MKTLVHFRFDLHLYYTYGTYVESNVPQVLGVSLFSMTSYINFVTACVTLSDNSYFASSISSNCWVT